ncbi:hypothetical protein ASPWEDRAFT_168205 [Aspergillus wentii DTO 134E9]|uniref:Uncharacterized protein n=1 Tax=Aspergillus wentii DTO 134E9 TaxID=1073089 RepID=A0A1L9RTV2_ASPWE|nr:uncharacterized protein ASPWEDRAFT_168205 [Aspergillus wentii DTO 134E9]KAI9933930.1 hypothetical protein MW887_005002 [Aspergillus wentii]OJJ38288.1 hypothetical protein ASPWEDRAFT_168205 [Aspergillus wentii DTO 134E9]
MLSTPTGRPYRQPISPPSLKIGRVGRWYLPLMAVISLGFGVANYYPAQSTHDDFLEQQRLEENRRLMDAYGDKDSLKDVERAMQFYKK